MKVISRTHDYATLRIASFLGLQMTKADKLLCKLGSDFLFDLSNLRLQHIQGLNA